MDSEKKWLKNKAMIIMLAVIIIAASLILPGLNNGLVVRNYTIDSPDIGEPINIALVTDLHSCDYGNGQQELIAEIDSQKPDFIALSGDIFDDVLDNANTEAFISAALAPATVESVVKLPDGDRSYRVTVADDQLSLAIGKEGQNARLAAKLTGFKIDIKSNRSASEE